MIDRDAIKNLRERTGAGVQDCKHALDESKGNIDEAAVILRKKGMATVLKKAGRVATEGVVASYIHLGGKIGVLLEVNCETDFVARSDVFKAFVKNLTLQIAGMKPEYVRREDIPQERLEKEKQILTEQTKNEGKPENLIDKIVLGKLDKFYKDVCLLDQTFFKDETKTISDLLSEITLRVGEKVTIRRFVRYEMGEGLTK